MTHVTQENESGRIYEFLTRRGASVTCDTEQHVSSHTWLMNHVTHQNESRHTCEFLARRGAGVT